MKASTAVTKQTELTGHTLVKLNVPWAIILSLLGVLVACAAIIVLILASLTEERPKALEITPGSTSSLFDLKTGLDREASTMSSVLPPRIGVPDKEPLVFGGGEYNPWHQKDKNKRPVLTSPAKTRRFFFQRESTTSTMTTDISSRKESGQSDISQQSDRKSSGTLSVEPGMTRSSTGTASLSNVPLVVKDDVRSKPAPSPRISSKVHPHEARQGWSDGKSKSKPESKQDSKEDTRRHDTRRERKTDTKAETNTDAKRPAVNMELKPIPVIEKRHERKADAEDKKAKNDYYSNMATEEIPASRPVPRATKQADDQRDRRDVSSRSTPSERKVDQNQVSPSPETPLQQPEAKPDTRHSDKDNKSNVQAETSSTQRKRTHTDAVDTKRNTNNDNTKTSETVKTENKADDKKHTHNDETKRHVAVNSVKTPETVKRDSRSDTKKHVAHSDVKTHETKWKENKSEKADRGPPQREDTEVAAPVIVVSPYGTQMPTHKQASTKPVEKKKLTQTEKKFQDMSSIYKQKLTHEKDRYGRIIKKPVGGQPGGTPRHVQREDSW